MTLSSPLAELLEALGLEPRAAEPAFFEELFLRFQRVVPHAPSTAAEPADALAARFVSDETGASGAGRTRAFAALSRGLGFDVDFVAAADGGAAPSGSASAALVARLAGRDVLADVAFPMPVLLPLTPPAAEIPTAWGKASIELSGAVARVVVEGHGEARVRAAYDLSSRAAAAPADEDRSTGDAPGGTETAWRLRIFDDRAVRWSEGRLEVVDAWSRLTYPLDGSEAETLEALFGQPARDLRGVVAAAGPARLVVFDASPLPSAVLRARLETLDGLATLLPEGVQATDVLRGDKGWTWTLRGADGRALRRERIAVEPSGVAVETLEGDHPVKSRRLVLEERADGTRVTLDATLAKEVPPRGLAESVRRTLVFHLASELLALSRDEPPLRGPSG